MILAVLSPVAQHANGIRKLGVARGHCAAFAVCSEILAGIKTEAGHIADAADEAAFVFCAVSLRGVFDHDESMAPCDFHDWVHVGGLAVEMHR